MTQGFGGFVFLFPSVLLLSRWAWATSVEFQVAKLGTGRVAPGVAAPRVRPSWPEGAGGVAGKVFNTCLEGRPEQQHFTGTCLVAKWLPALPCSLGGCQDES